MKTDVYEKEATVRRGSGDKFGSWKPAAGQDDKIKKMDAAGTPGPAHKALDALVGNWKGEVKCWLDPAGEPNVSQATSKASWTLDGHFLEEEFRGEMMGQPFTGLLLMGYDNTKQKFNSVWVDSLHTSMFTSEGKGDNDNKVITLEGRMDYPGTDRKNVPMKLVFRVPSRDKHVLEMFNDGARTMEITYTRQ